MSFSSDVKKELARNISAARHCRIAELAGMIGMVGHVGAYKEAVRSCA